MCMIIVEKNCKVVIMRYLKKNKGWQRTTSETRRALRVKHISKSERKRRRKERVKSIVSCRICLSIYKKGIRGRRNRKGEKRKEEVKWIKSDRYLIASVIIIVENVKLLDMGFQGSPVHQRVILEFPRALFITQIFPFYKIFHLKKATFRKFDGRRGKK